MRPTMQERNHACKGGGFLQGPPWHWTAWHSLSLLPDGGDVDPRDQLLPDGLLVDNIWADGQGHASNAMAERCWPVSAAEFQAKRRQVFPD
ncbi:MAG: hypothetical protein H7338_14865 [Candidatus Sericytochromatia bacterium]|nr:hypothetical protein [Candidatus Sericytochromatia bacterium]